MKNTPIESDSTRSMQSASPHWYIAMTATVLIVAFAIRFGSGLFDSILNPALRLTIMPFPYYGPLSLILLLSWMQTAGNMRWYSWQLQACLASGFTSLTVTAVADLVSDYLLYSQHLGKNPLGFLFGISSVLIFACGAMVILWWAKTLKERERQKSQHREFLLNSSPCNHTETK